MKAIERILVPTDCSAGSDAAAEIAAELAIRLKASVDVIVVVDPAISVEISGDAARRSPRTGDIDGPAQTDAEQFASRHFRGLDRVQVHVRGGNAFLEILQAARELNSDMIVMGTRGRTGLSSPVIGSIAERVVRASEVPVLTVRRPH